MKKIILFSILISLLVSTGPIMPYAIWAAEETAAVAKPPKKSPVTILIENLQSKDAAVSQNAREGLIKKGEKAVPKLIKALSGADPYLKSEIIFILGNIQDKRAVPVLDELTRDENAYIRRSAVEALTKIKDESVLNILSGSLLDLDSSVRERAAKGLGELGDQRETSSLINRLQDEKEDLVRAAVISALGKLKDTNATGILIEELNKEGISPLCQAQVLSALAQIKDQKSLPALNDYLAKLNASQPQEAVVKELKVEESGVEDVRAAMLKKMQAAELKEKIAQIEVIIKEIQEGP